MKFVLSLLVLGLQSFFVSSQSVGETFTLYEVGNKVLYISNQQLSWYDALESCRRHNLTIASIESAEEDTIARGGCAALFTDPARLVSRTDWLAIGGYRFKDAKFRWMADGTVVNYNNYDVNQPDNWKDIEYCILLNCYHGKWNDGYCGTAFYYACQRKTN
ncbi:hypothetical protein DMENIID0001_038510 [Sergentomyia squamirostris]